MGGEGSVTADVVASAMNTGTLSEYGSFPEHIIINLREVNLRHAPCGCVGFEEFV